MSVNASSFSNDSLLHSDLCFSDLPLFLCCVMSRPGSFIFTSYVIAIILLLLPLCIFIIYHGLQQWRQKRSTSSAAAMSHSDIFTYNMVTMELIHVFGAVLCCCGIFSDRLIIFFVGFFFFSFAWYGEMFFHVLTCVERYLAVVHPITYLSLRNERGIRIRNISIGCVWLLCFVGTSLMIVEILIVIVTYCFLIISLAIVFFCSLSVLCVLIRPGPGEQGGDRERVDQTKQRAFHTIMAILGVLVVRFTTNMAWSGIYSNGAQCGIMTSALWFNLPSALVLPLLFLHRAGKLVCWKNNIQ